MTEPSAEILRITYIALILGTASCLAVVAACVIHGIAARLKKKPRERFRFGLSKSV
jgi:hypothetical protein